MQPIVRPRGPRPWPWRSARRPLLGLSMLLLLAGALAYGALVVPSSGDEIPSGVRVAMVVVASLMALAGLFAAASLLTTGNRLPRFTVDDEGLAVWSPYGSAEIAWSHVLAAGSTYKVAPVGNPARTRSGRALEIFVSDPDPATSYPRADRLLVDDEPRTERLAGTRFRIILTGDVTRRLTAEVAPRLGERWQGEYRRAWTVVL